MGEENGGKTMALPKWNKAQKFVVTAVNPASGSVSIESFVVGDYIDWDSKKCNDEQQMNQHIYFLIKKQYPVVVSQTKLNQLNGLVEHQVVINIHPESVDCNCDKGILCPLNKQQTNYWNGQIVTKQMLAK